MLVLPFLLGAYETHILIMSFYYIVLACSWNLIAGYTGQFSLAHLAFAGIGGYASALLALNFGVPPYAGIFIGGMVAMAASYFIGHIFLRVRAIYLAIATWAFAGSFELFVSMEYKWTGGDVGLQTPRLIETSSTIPYFYVGFTMMILSTFIMYKIVNSRIGLYIRAISEDEEAASTMAVNVDKWKKFIFVTSGFFAGMAGAFQAHYIGLISPTALGFDAMVTVIMMTIIGGYGAFFGPIVGAPLIEILTEYLRVFGEIRLVLFGVVVIAIVRFFRGGLVELFKSVYARYFKGLRRIARAG